MTDAHTHEAYGATRHSRKAHGNKGKAQDFRGWTQA